MLWRDYNDLERINEQKVFKDPLIIETFLHKKRKILLLYSPRKF